MIRAKTIFLTLIYSGPYTRGTKIASQTVSMLRLYPNTFNMFVSLSHEYQSGNQFIPSVKAAEGSSQISIHKIDNKFKKCLYFQSGPQLIFVFDC